ncbi:hypothetical protein QBC33DRAFT_561104 [Phialemonium atrogriseum]|uniref:Uncharacterized protein n=1 Tax=Phialemonium atrogriseum TaxID=1093897 RepID=A0AAJ0FFB4_9PEZI|nr:uncharacterized protein QBC33DRAFT_561104 [Phialemonium atrogriseum]KAK1765282.1 hypothetical protein QBC33DRAFT_561104 [Phialemonium atrogriseum]
MPLLGAGSREPSSIKVAIRASDVLFTIVGFFSGSIMAMVLCVVFIKSPDEIARSAAILDNEKFRFRRQTRRLIAFIAVAFIVILAAQAIIDGPISAFHSMTLLFDITYTTNQIAVIWILSSFTYEPRLLARYGGFSIAMLISGLCLVFKSEGEIVQ